MSLQVEKMEKNMAKLTIEVSAEDLDKAMQNAYQKAKGRISIPGFRKGKAPRKMIEQMYGKGVFLEDAANALIPEHYSKALAECDLEIVSQPKIDHFSWSFSFTESRNRNSAFCFLICILHCFVKILGGNLDCKFRHVFLHFLHL